MIKNKTESLNSYTYIYDTEYMNKDLPMGAGGVVSVGKVHV